MRLTMGAAIVAIYAALTASELWSERRRTMQKRWPTIAVPVMHGGVLMLPILLGNIFRPHDETFGSSIWVTAFSIELVLYAIGTVFVIFMLVSDRAVTVHKTAASIDPLSGMLNRRGFSEASARVIEREAAAERPVTVLIFDIDHFKSINDRFGHPAGDEILKLFSTVVVSNLRISDLSGRIGGEEFAALLACPLEEGVIVAERVREAFEASNIACEEGPVDTTVSIGVAGGPAGTELDVLLAAASLVLLLPFMLLTALLIRVTSPGPAIFGRTRIGRGNRNFTLYKFRTMYSDPELRVTGAFTPDNDPRVTPFGKWLRRTRLDELPQLFNVLKGDMAIVGPRPERPEFVRILAQQIPFYQQRQCVKPGITGLAQINHELEDARMILEYDLYYVRNLSPALDILILLHTVKMAFF